MQKDSKLPLDRGNKLKEGHGGLQKGEDFFWGVCGEEKKRRMKCEEVVSSWVWEVFVERL